MAKTPAELDKLTRMNGSAPNSPAALTPAALASATKKKKRRSRPLYDGRASSLAATAQVQEDLLATASDLYRRIEADPHGLRDDEAYWKSLPAHLRTFIRNALPLGQFANAGEHADAAAAAVADDDAQQPPGVPPPPPPPPGNVPPRHASTQAMIAVAQQLAQAAHAPQTPLPDIYRTTKQRFMPNMTVPMSEDGDLVFVDDFDDDSELEHTYASDDAFDDERSDEVESDKKKKSKKKKKKAPAAVAAAPAAPLPPAPLPHPAAPRTTPKRNMLPVSLTQPPHAHTPLPSSRAAGKLPMMFHAPRAAGGTPPPPSAHAYAQPPVQRRRNTLQVGSKHAPPMFPVHMAGAAPPASGSGLTIGSAEERRQIASFWRALSRPERRALMEGEERNVQRKLREFQRHGCACAICTRKRATIDTKLSELYASYYDAAEAQATAPADDEIDYEMLAADVDADAAALAPGPFPGSVALDRHGGVLGANLILARYAMRSRRRKYTGTCPGTPPNEALVERRGLPPPPLSEDGVDDLYYDELDDADEYDDEYEDEYERRAHVQGQGQCLSPDCYCINSTLTVKGILSVADELSGNEVQKLVLMMEQFIERSMALDSGDDTDSASEHSEIELSPDEQREQGWRMFQIFAARVLEHRVLQKYREHVAQERQRQLLAELEEEESNEKAKEAKRAKENQRKKDKKRQLKQQKEEERLKREQEKAAEEAAAREAELQRLEQQRKEQQRKEAQRKEAERKEAERKEAQRKEAERKEAERKEAQRKEAERKEAERKEAERKEAERKEAERKEAERKEAQRKEAERKREAQRKEQLRKETERKEAERRDAQRKAADRKAEADDKKRRNQERRQRGKKESDVPVSAPAPPQSSVSSPAPASAPASASAPTPAPAPPSAIPAAAASPASRVPTSVPGLNPAPNPTPTPAVPGERAGLFYDSFAPLPFGAHDEWDHSRLPSLHTRHAFESVSPPAPPSRVPPFMDYLPQATQSLNRLSLHASSPPGAGSVHSVSRDFGLQRTPWPVPQAARELGTPTAVSPPRGEAPARPFVPPPIGPIERPHRSVTTGPDPVTEGVLGSAALGDDEPIEPLIRRAAPAPPLTTTASGTGPFYSPWSAAPGGYHLGLGSALSSGGAESVPPAPRWEAPAHGTSASMPGAPAPASFARTFDARPSPAAGAPGFESAAAAWSSSWDRARHAFEQPMDPLADLGSAASSPFSGSNARHAKFSYR